MIKLKDLLEGLPTTLKKLKKVKKVKHEPDSAKGKHYSTATFSKHHAGSMGAGDMGTMAEPDTYDWDDSGSEPNDGGHQLEKDKKKTGYEPVEEGKVNQSKVNSSFYKVVAFIRKESKKLNDDDLYAMTRKLEKWLK